MIDGRKVEVTRWRLLSFSTSLLVKRCELSVVSFYGRPTLVKGLEHCRDVFGVEKLKWCGIADGEKV